MSIMPICPSLYKGMIYIYILYLYVCYNLSHHCSHDLPGTTGVPEAKAGKSDSWIQGYLARDPSKITTCSVGNPNLNL